MYAQKTIKQEKQKGWGKMIKTSFIETKYYFIFEVI